MLGYILIAILMFGFLIAIHEFGHFIVAKLLGVRVNEFSIGMGPQVFSRQKGETQYSLRALPIGGFCAMEGADGLMPGDRIVSIDGHRIFLVEDVNLFLSRTNGKRMDLVVEREGQKIRLDDFPLAPQYYEYNGEQQKMFGLSFEYVYKPTIAERLKLGCFQALDYVRMVWVSLGDLVTGAVGLKDLSGPIGIVNAIGEIGQSAPNVMLAVADILNFVAFIAINLAVMNLLPIPALDGGQILFLLVNSLYTFFTRRKLDQKYLSYVNVAGFVFLLALMAVVAVSDVAKLIR